MKNSKGFTLIELLVVIAIIGILSSIVLGSLNSARAKARDAKRKTDMTTIQTALELYYLDHGAYPVTTTVGYEWRGYHTGVYGFEGCGVNGTLSGPNGYIPDLAPQYIPELPIDPTNRSNPFGCYYGYLYSSNGKDYALLDLYLPESWPAANTKFWDNCRDGWGWKVCNTNDKTSDTSYCYW